MTTMVTEVYEALIEAGASKENARRAAAVLTERDSDVTSLKADMTMFKWMVGALLERHPVDWNRLDHGGMRYAFPPLPNLARRKSAAHSANPSRVPVRGKTL